MQILLEPLLSILLGIYPELELLDHMVTLCFIFLITPHTVFHSGFPILHSYQQCTKVLMFRHPLQHLLLSFLHNSYPNGYEVVSYCGLTCLVLRISTYLSMCSLAAGTSSLEKCLGKFPIL